MSRRSEHLVEMRVALAEGCSLPEAKRRLERLRWRKVAARFDVPVDASDVSAPSPSLSPEGVRGAHYWWQDQ